MLADCAVITEGSVRFIVRGLIAFTIILIAARNMTHQMVERKSIKDFIQSQYAGCFQAPKEITDSSFVKVSARRESEV